MSGQRWLALGGTAAIAGLLSASVCADVNGTVVAAKRAGPEVPGVSDRLSPVAVEQRVFEQINNARKQKGLRPVRPAPDLVTPARNHSKYMAAANGITHLDARGQGPGERLDARGIDWIRYGENVGLVKGYADPTRTVVQAWLRSASHAANILNPSLTESAVGVAVAADGTYFLTQVFVTRQTH